MAGTSTATVAPVTVTAAPRASGGVTTFQPQISVILKKNIGRSSLGQGVATSQRYQGRAPEIDLTPYLGLESSVVVSRSTRDPAGMFSVSISDKMDPDQFESVYGLAEPMDVIEIRMAHNPSLYSGALPSSLPIVMRGFVSDIRREQSMTPQGPHRSVIISGQDYGKILQIMRIAYLPGMVLGQDLLTDFKLFTNYGLDTTDFPDAATFISNVVQNVVWPFQANMRAAAAGGGTDARSPVVDLAVEATVSGGAVAPFGSQEWPGGTVYDLMKYFGDVGAWNELYVEDRSDGPYLIYRPTPFKSVSGEMIQPSDSTPTTIVVKDDEVVDLSLSRSDANVANYYWVTAPHYDLIDGTLLQAASAAVTGGQTPDWYLKTYPNSSPSFYGIRLMELETQQGKRIDGQATGDQSPSDDLGIGYVTARRDVLLKNNEDNIVFESGSLRMRGNEALKHGYYIDLRRGAKQTPVGEYYAYQVIHQFTPFRSFTTTVNFDRGTGFIVRAQRGGGADSAYLAEMSLRGAYGG